MKKIYAEYAKPFLVLAVICAVVSALLGYTNSVTAPLIAANAASAAEATRAELLPEAEGFEELASDVPGVSSVYADIGGSGYVITAAFKGYGGDVAVTVALDPDGAVIGISADVSTETVGVGSKAGEADYLNRYLGQSGTAQVDAVTGATYTSSAVQRGVNAALLAFEGIAGEAE